MDKIDVKALEIRDYAISQGWALVKEALKDGLFVLNSPTNDFTQLIFPKDDSISEYQEMAMVSIRRLTEFYKLPLNKVVEDIREVNDDVIALRYFSDSKTVNSISFQEALDSIDATKQVLLSAASTVVNPVTFHPKLNRTEAQDLIKKARFRHTEEGSFILKVSIPFELTHAPIPSLFGETIETPFSRKAIEVVSKSSIILLDTIDSDSITDLYKIQSADEHPLISYNFCDAVSKLFDEERELPFQLIFNWSKASLMKLPAPALPQRITFPFSHKNKIEEIREYFTPKRNDLQDDFIATVETLDGSIGEDGKRSGPVVLSILYENEIIKARVNLNSDAYAVAVEAHKKGGSYVEINGLLKRNKRSNTIEEIKTFKLRGS
ncbi:MAG: hypothetical protein PHQ11_11425 [Paludibacter sp.]|nr:hypothetical protein [Paludibacter sp.]